MQFHSCGEADILIGSYFAISPQSSQLEAQNIALGGEGQGARQVGSITGSSLVSSETACFCRFLYVKDGM